MSSRMISRRGLLAGGAFGALLAGGLTRAHAQTVQAGFQLSWLHSVQFAGSYLALENGWWQESGLQVSLLQGGPNAPVEPPVVAGTALVGISAADYAASAIEQGGDFRIIGVAMQKNPFVIASLPANPVNVPADLQGKRIGMAIANTPVLKALCSLNNVDFNAITIVPTQYSAQPLVSNEVDCLLCWETDLPVAMAMNGIKAVTMLMADHGYSLHSQTYITTRDSLASRRKDLVALMAGELRGWQAYHSDTDAAAELTLRMFPDAGLDLATQKLQAKRQVPLMFSDLTDANGFGWWSDESVAANIRTLALLGHKVSPDLWDRSILDEIQAG
ncbi:ABC transporter substrate-binding protein [Paracoccus aestuariivivens]|uniref:Thiamine pyrimidine synthase n=1 Tax=Paracoccus aestuariivivens TaxID=1820333 RepID=A0A6L6J4N2_9RHOB|nr:ABC transporter substrate-binding protein [Paracoccus aestuariivivens]MTH76840.1 twin-arginine translocation pathway signal protein [Paracoccus aestuariivivens]